MKALQTIGQFVLTILVVTFLVFACMHLAPGGPDALLFGNREPSPEVRAAVEARFNLDKPMIVQYWLWLSGAVTGDFGVSLVGSQPVAERIMGPLGLTLLLVALTSIVIIVVGVGLGVLAAGVRGWGEKAITAATSTAFAIPTFAVANVLIYVFAIRLRMFPAYGFDTSSLGAMIWSLVLPVLALALFRIGLVVQVTRAAVREEIARDHIQTATVRGVSGPVIMRTHVARNIFAPVSTLTGVQIAGLFSATVVVEYAFGLNGIGSLLLSAVSQQDFPTVQAITVILIVAYTSTNLIVDLLQLANDPRLRRSVAA